MTAAHSYWSASKFESIMLCPGKIVLEDGAPDNTNAYAAEGTAAHQVLTWALQEDRPAGAYIGRLIHLDERGKPCDPFAAKYTYQVDDEIAEHVQVCVDYVNDLKGDDGVVFADIRVNYSTYLDVAEDTAWGTADVIIARGDELIVVDFKYGRGVEVDAEKNPQMSLYGLGALQAYQGLVADFERVRMAISQPRVKRAPSEWDCSVEELEAWGRSTARSAVATCTNASMYEKGSEWEKTFLRPAEKACKFCKAKATCPALRAEVINTISPARPADASDFEVLTDLQPGKPEFIVTPRAAAANALGVSAQSIAAELRAAFRGDTALEFQDRLGGVDVVVGLSPDSRAGLADILDLPISANSGAQVPLSAVADVTLARGYATINRVNGQRAVSVQGSINPDVANARELMVALKTEYLPGLSEKRPEVRVSILGEAEDTAETGSSLLRNMVIGLIGVYLILAFQFRSFMLPVVVLVAIPLSVIGVVWGHMALGLQISLPSLVGLATLMGVVVNNSILLVAFIEEQFEGGTDLLKSAQAAVAERFRAIFLTSLTTVVGLGPLLLEQSTQAQFLRPIVASLAFGLSASTLLALFVTPAMVLVLNDLGLYRRDHAEDEPGTAPA